MIIVPDAPCSAGIVKQACTVARNIELEMIMNGWA